MWTYSQKTGDLLHDGKFRGTGYSGTSIGRNRPSAENIAGVGPIPQGIYKISSSYNDPHLGPCVMQLNPEPGTYTFGRSLFRIHGDNSRNDASHGCIILGPSIRREIAESNDNELTVTE